jgi:esterase/lipase superfamily enzyme
MTTSEVATQVLVLVMSMPGGSLTPDRLSTEVSRISKFRRSGLSGLLPTKAVAVTNSAQIADALHTHRPAIVHFRSAGDNSVLDQDGLSAVVQSIRELNINRHGCVILEDCFSLQRAEAIAESAHAVIGINGQFAENLLTSFYARLNVDGPIYEYFRSALYQFYNRDRSTAFAGDDERPYFIARDRTILESGFAGAQNSTPGVGIAGRMFQAKTPNEQAVAYPLCYGTNRRPVDPDDLKKGYSGERDDKVHYGTCTVIVPKSQDIGSLGSSWWQRLFSLKEHSQLELDWSTLRSWSEHNYWKRIREQIVTDPSGACVLYIHGYNASFESAALRAAQIGVDLKVSGVMAFFSWPSKGTFRGYKPDEASVDGCEFALQEYLTSLLKIVGNRRVHIIAHSMGNRAFLRVTSDILLRITERRDVKIGQIFLAAPDVDADLFRKLAPACEKLSTRTTLYVSSRDLALASSGFISDYPRAGFTPPITIIPSIDTVETSNVDLSLLGHGYYADCRAVLQDMFVLIGRDAPPKRRFGLLERSIDGNTYWEIRR